MADAFETITKLINSPPGQIAAGGVLATVVWKFFERVETISDEDSKLQIAVWLLDLRMAGRAQHWSEAFATIFDRVFGRKHLSWRCFVRSCLASIASTVFMMLALWFHWAAEFAATMSFFRSHFLMFLGTIICGNLLPDYASLLETRYVMQRIVASQDDLAKVTQWLGVDLLITTAIAFFTQDAIERISLAYLVSRVPGALSQDAELYRVHVMYAGNWLLWFPAYFTSLWLWLYVGSGFLVKSARRLDLGFQWFNRRVDLEKHPLQSIGLVAGALVAVVYWSAALVSRFVR